MRIIISDDHPVVLTGLKTLLHAYADRFRVVGEANDGAELERVLMREPCDLLITDFSMPGPDPAEDGLPLLTRLRVNHPNLSILVLTMLINPALVQAMLATGIRGVVDKTAMTKELTLAIEVVLSGRVYLSSRIRRQLDATTGNDATSLSPREAEVVRFLALGLTVSEIARRIERSVKTVSQQKRDAMRKLGLEGDKQLYDYARSHGLL